MQLRLLELQVLDARLDQLAHRRGAVPEAAEADRLATERGKLESELVGAETELTDLGREQRKADADVEQVRSRHQRDEKRLQAGQVSSPKELEGLQHEIESLTKRQADLEDVELEIMERLENATKRHADLLDQRTELEERLAEAERTRDQAFSEIDAETGQLRADRDALAAGIADGLLAQYDRLRRQYGGVGAAALRQRRCEGCRMELDASYLAKLAVAPADEVARCEECGRILVRTPESGV